MAHVEGCKHALEITISLPEVEAETERVIERIRQQARLPGFRAGKVPASLIKSRYAADIRQEVLESLLPKHFRRQAEAEELRVVGTPDVTEVKFEPGEPIHFKAEFEVAPAFDLKEYRELKVVYQEPQATDQDVDQRLEELRDQKADYVNVDPRPVADGDFAVVTLKSVGGIDGPPIERAELMLHVGGDDTLPDFNGNLLGMSPEEEKEFDVSYPANFGQPRLAGKTVRFHCRLKVIRRKELPEMNDEFARDLGDYKDLAELREAMRKSLFREKQTHAQADARQKLVDKLVDAHDFPVPEFYVNRQIENQVEQQLRLLAAQGVDPRGLKVDWETVRSKQRDRAVREVKASLLLDKIAEGEALDAMQDEVDREVQRIAKQDREPVAATRRRLEKDGALARIAHHIRTEKTLGFLFDHARKVAEE